jgi:putative membrane protein
MSKPLVAVAISSLLFGACAKQTPPPEAAPSLPPAETTVVAEAPPPPPEPVAPPVELPPPPAPLTDAQIAKVLDAVDTSEIAQAKVAQKKSKNPKVKKFAAHMIQAHTKSKTKATAWVKKAKLTPEESPVSQELSEKAAQNLATLEGADATTFDAAYIAAQAQQHNEVLALIDGRLAPGATDEKLKAFLGETRTMVETHATEAKELESSVTTPATSAAPSPATPGVGGANKEPAPGPASSTP